VEALKGRVGPAANNRTPSARDQIRRLLPHGGGPVHWFVFSLDAASTGPAAILQ
jgi:hypothetical protein